MGVMTRVELEAAMKTGANLSGADLSGVNGLVVLGPGDYGCLIYVVRFPDGKVRVMAGCHWFNEAQAEAHWAGRKDRAITWHLVRADIAALCMEA